MSDIDRNNMTAHYGAWGVGLSVAEIQWISERPGVKAVYQDGDSWSEWGEINVLDTHMHVVIVLDEDADVRGLSSVLYTNFRGIQGPILSDFHDWSIQAPYPLTTVAQLDAAFASVVE